MSFSGTVKEELARVMDSGRHCQLAELGAEIAAMGEIVSGEEGLTLFIRSENESAIRKCFTLLEKTFNIVTDIVICHSSRKRKAPVYEIAVDQRHEGEALFEAFKLPKEEGPARVSGGMLTMQRCCKRAYLRGSFLSAGSISDPNKGYHFEIVSPDMERAIFCRDLMGFFELDAKIVLRKHSYVVYVKEGNQIVDLLALMGASSALMELENIRILKEMRNSVNRRVNCETANINKTVSAAVKQLEDIRLIEERTGFAGLNEPLAEMARLRLMYPDASLKELGEMLMPPVGKSGVNHRLRKLSLIAQQLREHEEEIL